MVSVIIAAHNEESSIGECLDAVLRERDVSPGDVVVSANACSDATAAIARHHGVVVIEREAPGKAAALNAAERVASGFPRIYLDADIVMPEGGIAALLRSLDRGTLATVPRRQVVLTGRPWLVRAYFSVNERLPAFRSGLFGRGMIALSETGRGRFDEFPELIADDLFLDSQFSPEEKTETGDVVVTVEAPFTVKDLIRRLARVRRGNSQLRAASSTGSVDAPVRPSDKWAWLREVVLKDSRLWPAAVPYAMITIVSAVLARHRTTSWGRDESTRMPQARRSATL